MSSWKNDNLLKKLRESLPVDERDSYAAWKRDYDYKNSPEGSREDLQRRLDDYKSERAAEFCEDLASDAFRVWDYYYDKMHGEYLNLERTEGSFDFTTDYIETLRHFEINPHDFDCMEILFVADSLARDYDEPGDFNNVAQSFVESGGNGCGITISIDTGFFENYAGKPEEACKRLLHGLQKKIENAIYKGKKSPFIVSKDTYFVYYWDVLTDSVENAKKVIDLIASFVY